MGIVQLKRNCADNASITKNGFDQAVLWRDKIFMSWCSWYAEAQTTCGCRWRQSEEKRAWVCYVNYYLATGGFICQSSNLIDGNVLYGLHSQDHGKLTVLYHSRHFGLYGEGLDCGDEAAKWFEEFLEKPGHRLYNGFSGSLQRRELRKEPVWGNTVHPSDKVMISLLLYS